ncbi:MAG: protein translocase subunit SecD [Actinomycetota bacterium]
MNRRLIWRGLLVVVVAVASGVLALNRPARLGLDLKGGSQMVLEAHSAQADGDAVSRTLEVLRRRVDQLGVAEPSLQRSGENRIIVELPGLSDPQQAVEVIGRTAQLEFRAVRGTERSQGEPASPEQTPGSGGSDQGAETEQVLPDEDGQRLRLGPTAVSGGALRDAAAVIDTSSGAWSVQVEFTNSGGEEWADLTGNAACATPGDPQRRLAIVLDGMVISSPQVDPQIVCDEGITGGRTFITGSFSEEEAKELALLLRAGALPVPVQIVEQRTVGPTLGEAAIEASMRAAIIGSLLTIAYMIVYYRLLGLAAALALILYGLITFSALLALNATLTLPGIAGFVLAIGMALDANVLVFERIKEEHRATGKVSRAVSRGFSKAWSAIRDSNATTLLAAVLLIFLASGAVRGFGVTLTVGVLVSMFTALVVTRFLVEVMTRIGPLARRPGLLGMGSRRSLAERISSRQPNLMRHRRVWFSISLTLLLFAGAGLFLHGLNYGIDFTGGRLLEYSTQRSIDVDRLRAELAERGVPRALVQESGDANISVRTSRLSPAHVEAIESAVEQLGGQAERVRDEFVGPSIGDELRRKALIALGLALTAQLGYLALRFRWNYGLAAVAAMFHDVVLLVGLFAWLGKDIDGVFLAALLTVIGYSINDSVVVFDRIRERRAARSSEPLEVVANEACLQTIPRTLNTGLGALFILSALYFLGGESLSDFALALIAGILVGTYSSVFMAAPVSVWLDSRWPAPPPTRVRSSTASRTTSRKPVR